MILYRICDAFNGQYQIGHGIGEKFNGKGGIRDVFNSTALPWLAVCGWIVNLTIYCGIDDTDTQTERHIKLMIDWVILYKIGAFNVLYWIRNGIGNRFNNKLKADDILNWFIWLVVCGWILNFNTLGLMILQQQQQHQKYIKLIIKWYSTQEETHLLGGIELETASNTYSMAFPILVGLAGSVWLNT